jgi:5-methylcytosine-specific restriction endonuclease McrA
MKLCSVCDIEKGLNEFYFRKDKNSYRSECKECNKKKVKLWNQNNLEKSKKRSERYRKNNLERAKESCVQWRKNNTDYKSNRKKIDPTYKMTENIRKRMYSYFRLNGISKKNRTFDIVGLEPKDLKVYLEKKFEKNMNWENYGEWHIDHIIPLSSAKSEEQLYDLCYYTNLQPLWKRDNLIKGNKII